MFNFKTVLKWSLIGIGAIIAIAFIITQVIMKFMIPFFTEQLAVYNVLAVALVTLIPVMFLVQILLTIPHWYLRVFSNEEYAVIDGMLPIISDLKARKQYIDLTNEEYIKANGYGGFAILIVKLLGNLLIILPIGLYTCVFVWGTYIYLTVGMYMFTNVHVVWILASILLYSMCVSINTVCNGIACYTLNPYIRSFNPKKLIVLPAILPIVSLGYIIYLAIGLITGNLVNVGMLNIIAFTGVPLINPLIAVLQSRKAVYDSKITIDDDRRRCGEPPMTW